MEISVNNILLLFLYVSYLHLIISRTLFAGLEKPGDRGTVPPDRINVNSWGTGGPKKCKNGPFRMTFNFLLLSELVIKYFIPRFMDGMAAPLALQKYV